MLRERGIDVWCEIVGEGPLHDHLAEQVASSGLESHVHLCGALPQPGVVRLLHTADVAVLASYPTKDGRKEGIPVALMEAMAAELPVVASSISGIPELVSLDAGILVPPGDPSALADALGRLEASEELRKKMGVAGRRIVERDFDLTANAARLRDLVLSTHQHL
jgi:glycosyltransferase involved in cell wall biosynthesis